MIRALVIDDQPTDAAFVSRCLRSCIPQMTVDSADSAERALQMLGSQSYDCLIVDHRLPGISGLELIKRLRGRFGADRPAVVMLTGQGTEQTAAAAIKLGASDYISKHGLDPDDLALIVLRAIKKQLRLRALSDERARLSYQATHDELTGLRNRSALQEHLKHLIQRARRTREPFAVVAIDLDGFKQINDEHGHPVGDEVLARCAQRMDDATRDCDYFYRNGGDEFIGVLETGVNADTIDRTVRRLTRKLSEPIVIPQLAAPICLGASIGTALYPDDGHTADRLLAAADSAMYLSKHAHHGEMRRTGPQQPMAGGVQR